MESVLRALSQFDWGAFWIGSCAGVVISYLCNRNILLTSVDCMTKTNEAMKEVIEANKAELKRLAEKREQQ